MKHDSAGSLLGGEIRRQRTAPKPEKLIYIFSADFAGPKEEKLDVVGEAYFQPAIWDACGVGGEDDVINFSCFADLVPQPDNRYDPAAIIVKIENRQVGYLAREATQRFSSAIIDAIATQGTSKCKALITGRHFQKNFLDVYVYLSMKPS